MIVRNIVVWRLYGCIDAGTGRSVSDSRLLRYLLARVRVEWDGTVSDRPGRLS